MGATLPLRNFSPRRTAARAGSSSPFIADLRIYPQAPLLPRSHNRYPPDGLYSIQLRQADIQENQVRLAAPGFLNGVQSICSLPDDPKPRSSQHPANAIPKARKVIDNQDSKALHLRLTIAKNAGSCKGLYHVIYARHERSSSSDHKLFPSGGINHPSSLRARETDGKRFCVAYSH